MLLHFLSEGKLLALSGEHIVLLLMIALLLFGGRKIPELMRGLGSGIREFNDAKNNVKREIEDGINKVSKESPTAPDTTTTTSGETQNNAWSFRRISYLI